MENGHGGDAKRLEGSELVRQAYGYELFTNPVEPVVKRAAMLL
jgi:hypothetical protein